ncbi:MAG TPA: YkvA family protein [Caulobacteraceae bacterium]|jgi:uncharacterized membrane protein YkvA (DUF1232 family)
MASEAKPTFDPMAPLDPSRALVPATVRVNEVRVQKGFWPKMRRVAAKIPFAKQLLSVWFSARDEETPLRAKGLMVAALAYFVLPTDVLPDVLTGIGFTDDAAVLFALLNLVGNHVKPKHKQAASETLERFRRD